MTNSMKKKWSVDFDNVVISGVTILPICAYSGDDDSSKPQHVIMFDRWADALIREIPNMGKEYVELMVECKGDMKEFMIQARVLDALRADGRCLCKICGEEYRTHNHVKTVLDYNGEPYLRELCNGRYVKL